MDFETLKKRAAKQLNLLDSSGEILTGKDITETKLGQAINDGYISDVYPMLQGQHSQDFEQTDYMPNYTVTGTVDAGSTASTLVATTAIFTELMIGLRVYNSTDSESAIITGYTNTTTVTLDTAIDDTWDGDTIVIFDNTFLLGGGTYDAYTVKNVFARYSTAGEYVRVTPRSYNDLYQSGTETFIDPVYWNTTSSGSRAISIRPLFSVPDTRALRIEWQKVPAEMSADADEPSLPTPHQTFLYWYGVKEGALLRRDKVLYQMAMSEIDMGKTNLLNHYRPTFSDQPVKVRISRRWDLFRSRKI